jgi:hypothetical protein
MSLMTRQLQTEKSLMVVAERSVRARKKITLSRSISTRLSRRRRKVPSYPSLKCARPTTVLMTPSGMVPPAWKRVTLKLTSLARYPQLSAPLHPFKHVLTSHYQTKSAPKARTEKKEKVFIEIEARFERPPRGGRGRGADRGEGRARGGRDRGGRGRGRANGTPSTPVVSVDDETAFPSLS